MNLQLHDLLGLIVELPILIHFGEPKFYQKPKV